MTADKPKPGRRLRRYFFTGLVVVAPVGVTIFVLAWIFRVIDGILGGLVFRVFGVELPGIGFLSLLLGILVIGWAVRQAAGRQLLQWWNLALVKFPLTGRVYHVTSQIIQAVVGEKKRVFRRAVLIPYPTDDLWAVAFVTNDTPTGFGGLEEACVNVFVPTTPNPTSGFMLIVPRRKTRILDVSVEEAMKLVISAGAVPPEIQSKPSRGLDVEHLLRDTGELRRVDIDRQD
jgi:uncharacterized membrane protein